MKSNMTHPTQIAIIQNLKNLAIIERETTRKTVLRKNTGKYFAIFFPPWMFLLVSKFSTDGMTKARSEAVMVVHWNQLGLLSNLVRTMKTCRAS